MNSKTIAEVVKRLVGETMVEFDSDGFHVDNDCEYNAAVLSEVIERLLEELYIIVSSVEYECDETVIEHVKNTRKNLEHIREQIEAHLAKFTYCEKKEFGDGEKPEIIRYTGKYPTLCYGYLYVKYKEETYILENVLKPDEQCRCTFGEGFEPIVEKGGWKVDIGKLPFELNQFADEIEEWANDNIESPCCGGCL